MLNLEKSPKFHDFYRTAKINKFLEGLSEGRKEKIHQVIQNELQKIKHSVNRQRENNQLQKSLEAKNLVQREELKMRIYEKIANAEKLREGKIEKVKKTQKVKIKYVRSINSKKNQIEKQKFHQEIKLKAQIMKQQQKNFIQKIKKMKSYYRSVQQLKTEYQNSIKKKQHIYDRSLKFADSSKEECHNRFQRREINSKSQIKNRLSLFVPHNIEVKQNYERAQKIQKNTTERFINNIVHQLKKSEIQMIKNDSNYEKLAKQKVQAQKERLQKVHQQKLNLRSTFTQKIKSCICYSREKRQENSDNYSDRQLSPTRKQQIYSRSKIRSSNSMYNSRSSNFLPIVQQHKNIIEKQQREKQMKIVNKHNQMGKLLKNTDQILMKTSSLQRSILFNKHKDENPELINL